MRSKDQPDALELLDQSEIWIDGQGFEHRIAEMEIRHLQNVRLWIFRNGAQLALQAENQVHSGFVPQGEEAMNGFNSMLNELEWACRNPDEWLLRSDLIQAIDERLKSKKEEPIGTREVVVTLALKVPNNRGDGMLRRDLKQALQAVKCEYRLGDFHVRR